MMMATRLSGAPGAGFPRCWSRAAGRPVPALQLTGQHANVCARARGPLAANRRIHAAASDSTGQQATQVLQASRSSNPASSSSKPRSPSSDQAANWDLNWWHYTPRFYKPHVVIIAGLSFIVGCNAATEPSLKTTVISATPVLFGWFIFLWLIPKQFKDFAKQYILTHPECEEYARSKQLQEQQEEQQHQQQH